MTANENVERRQLSVRNTFVDTWLFMRQNKDAIYKTLLYPCLGVMALSLLLSEKKIGSWSYPLMAVSTYLYTLIPIHCHRLLLVDDKQVANPFQWRLRHTKYLVVMLVLCLGLGILFFPILMTFSSLVSSIPDGERRLIKLSIFLVCIPFGYIFSRMSLVFPAIAVDQSSSFYRAWKLSAGHGAKLFLLIFALPATLSIINSLFGDGYLLTQLISALLAIIVLVFQTMLLSHAYQQLQPDHRKEVSPATG